MKKLKHLLEAAALLLVFAIFRLLPLDVASYLGGLIGRSIGPFLSAHRTAKKNLERVMPELTAAEQQKLLKDMWDNLGRNAAELPWLASKRLYTRVHISGIENLPEPDKASVFFSGHFGNWELLSLAAASQGVPLTSIYRSANNPYVDKIITAIRANHSIDMVPKGPRGGIKLGRAIKSGHALAMLVDQKMNEGIAVPFFGRDAMTAPAIAELALRYDMPLIPARAVRTKGCHFAATIYPALVFEKTGDEEKDVHAIMTDINAILESWIREYPAQWFWVHKRWPNKNDDPMIR